MPLMLFVFRRNFNFLVLFFFGFFFYRPSSQCLSLPTLHVFSCLSFY